MPRSHKDLGSLRKGAEQATEEGSKQCSCLSSSFSSCSDLPHGGRDWNAGARQSPSSPRQFWPCCLSQQASEDLRSETISHEEPGAAVEGTGGLWAGGGTQAATGHIQGSASPAPLCPSSLWLSSAHPRTPSAPAQHGTTLCTVGGGLRCRPCSSRVSWSCRQTISTTTGTLGTAGVTRGKDESIPRKMT